MGVVVKLLGDCVCLELGCFFGGEFKVLVGEECFSVCVCNYVGDCNEGLFCVFVIDGMCGSEFLRVCVLCVEDMGLMCGCDGKIYLNVCVVYV